MSLHSLKLKVRRRGATESATAPTERRPAPAGLSVRALNVLKELSAELMGECPPKGSAWCPPDELLRLLTGKHLATARNCGPHTTREIVEWAAARGIVIEPLSRAGKTLSAVWHDLAAEAAARKLTKAEITETLERSIRRGSARIPVAFQVVLLKILSSMYE
jgi:hypothetical protein